MEKKKKFIQKLDSGKLGSIAFAGILASGAVTSAFAGGAIASSEERNFDYDAAVQSAYEQKVDAAQKNFIYDVAMKQVTGELPNDFDVLKAKEEYLYHTSEHIMEITKLTTHDKRKDALPSALLGGFMGMACGFAAGGLGGSVAGWGVTNGIDILQTRARRKKEEEAEKAGAKELKKQEEEVEKARAKPYLRLVSNDDSKEM